MKIFLVTTSLLLHLQIHCRTFARSTLQPLLLQPFAFSRGSNIWMLRMWYPRFLRHLCITLLALRFLFSVVLWKLLVALCLIRLPQTNLRKFGSPLWVWFPWMLLLRFRDRSTSLGAVTFIILVLPPYLGHRTTSVLVGLAPSLLHSSAPGTVIASDHPLVSLWITSCILLVVLAEKSSLQYSETEPSTTHWSRLTSSQDRVTGQGSSKVSPTCKCPTRSWILVQLRKLREFSGCFRGGG